MLARDATRTCREVLAQFDMSGSKHPVSNRFPLMSSEHMKTCQTERRRCFLKGRMQACALLLQGILLEPGKESGLSDEGSFRKTVY
jgi:hypothetical protein